MAFFKLLVPLLLRISYLVAADDSQISLSQPQSIDSPHRIAIIGGGAAGSSAAYHLRTYANESLYNVPINITLFESSSRIGGRTTTVDAFNDDSLPVELGASIFVKANPILYNASLDFGLDVKSHFSEIKETESDFDLGIWDGKKFVFKQTSSGGRWQGYWDVVKLLWKYGISPVRAQRLTQDMIGKFLKMYEAPIFPFKTLQEAVEEVEQMHLLALTGEELMKEKGVSESFSNDIIQASTRVNYAQNLNQIHGLDSLVCMATDGAMAVEGGNWQIFNEMVERADVETMMGGTVTQINKDERSGKYVVKTESGLGDLRAAASFDTIILAAPYQFANIKFSPPLASTPESIDYVSLHVTLFTSPHLLSPAFFDLSEQNQVPSTILTTLPFRSLGEHDPNKFFSISTLRTIHAGRHSSKPQHLYKIFSSEPLKASLLAELYGFDLYPADEKEGNESGIEAVSEEHISWYHHKLWHSYPYAIPRTTFEDIRLDGEKDSSRGVWYTSGIESFVSTMETSALMGANVAKIIVEKLELETIDPGHMEDMESWQTIYAQGREHSGCGSCTANPCTCRGNDDYMSERCVSYREAVEARKSWQGAIAWRVRGVACILKSLAVGRPSMCYHTI